MRKVVLSVLLFCFYYSSYADVVLDPTTPLEIKGGKKYIVYVVNGTGAISIDNNYLIVEDYQEPKNETKEDINRLKIVEEYFYGYFNIFLIVLFYILPFIISFLYARKNFKK